MSHGGPHPASGSSYIIICDGRIAVGLSQTAEQMVREASACASAVTAYLGARYRSTFDHADLHPVSAIQHPLMEAVLGGKCPPKAEAAVICEDLFDALEALEMKYDSGGNVTY